MVDDHTNEHTGQPIGHRIGEDIAGTLTEMSSILGDAYRGELDRETTWRSRLDQTTTWAVTVVAAILTWAFSSPDNPHYVILVGGLAVTIFLVVEVRRYRAYDVYRSRVRLFQQNLIADALDPDQGLEHDDWRRELSRDYRTPTVKVSIPEATGNRLRRIHLPLLTVLLVAWIFRIVAFPDSGGPLATASISSIPGYLVLLFVGLVYGVLAVIALWPRDREAKGEFRPGDPGRWKE